MSPDNSKEQRESAGRSTGASTGIPPDVVGPEVGFRVTGYQGSEEQILAIRNSNRDSVRTRAYLDWRYDQTAGPDKVEVFWLDERPGVCIAMASIIPRLYWIDGSAEYVGVLGDISLNASYRGRGIGRQFLNFITRHREQSRAGESCLVIPTEAARQSLHSVGWQTGGRLVQFVIPLDPSEKLTERTRLRMISTPAGWLYRQAVSAHVSLRRRAGYVLDACRDFDSSFESFWIAVPKKALFMSDRSVASLRWRYARHPSHQFQTRRLLAGGTMAGYLVFDVVGSTCSIFDVMALSTRDLVQLLAMFIQQCIRDGLASIRVTLNDTHPYIPTFRAMGFFRRDSHTVFQLQGRVAGPGAHLSWMLTQGDKDI